MPPHNSDPDARIGPWHLLSGASTSDNDSDMQISNDDEPTTSRMDVDEPEVESEDEQVEVDVLPDAGSDSEASDMEVGEPEVEQEEPEEYELEEEDDEIQESRSPSVATAPKSPLKIKFKVRPGAVTRGRRTRATAIQIDSEDSSESEEEIPQNVRLTKRQAALAKARKGIASSETSVDEEPRDAPPPAKKRRGANAPIDPTELALRKEESARKRRNVSEKKLQTEKAETINRLLKKQSRPRTKRTSALSIAPPVEVPTPPVEAPVSGDENAEIARPDDAGDLAEAQLVLQPQDADPVATMYRWISTSRNPDGVEGDSGSIEDTRGDKMMRICFAVPLSVLPPPSVPNSEATDGASSAPPSMPAVCSVAGCTGGRRYRLAGAPWGAGACGMAHLKLLQATL